MALWGTGYDEGRAFIEIEHRNKMLQRYWTAPGNTQEQITLAVSEAMRGGFTLHVTQVRENRAYLSSRLVSVPWELGFEPPAGAELVPGRGTVLREGSGVALVATGPVMLSSAWAAGERLDATVIALPWHRGIDGDWLAGAAGEATVVVLDNHVADGGQGAAVRAALDGRAVHVVAVDGVPACGANEEVLRFHGLDAGSIVRAVGAVA